MTIVDPSNDHELCRACVLRVAVQPAPFEQPTIRLQCTRSPHEGFVHFDSAQNVTFRSAEKCTACGALGAALVCDICMRSFASRNGSALEAFPACGHAVDAKECKCWGLWGAEVPGSFSSPNTFLKYPRGGAAQPVDGGSLLWAASVRSDAYLRREYVPRVRRHPTAEKSYATYARLAHAVTDAITVGVDLASDVAASLDKMTGEQLRQMQELFGIASDPCPLPWCTRGLKDHTPDERARCAEYVVEREGIVGEHTAYLRELRVPRELPGEPHGDFGSWLARANKKRDDALAALELRFRSLSWRPT